MLSAFVHSLKLNIFLDNKRQMKTNTYQKDTRE